MPRSLLSGDSYEFSSVSARVGQVEGTERDYAPFWIFQFCFSFFLDDALPNYSGVRLFRSPLATGASFELFLNTPALPPCCCDQASPLRNAQAFLLVSPFRPKHIDTNAE